MAKKIIFYFILAGFCLTCLGCSAAQKEKIEDADQWIQEHMW